MQGKYFQVVLPRKHIHMNGRQNVVMQIQGPQLSEKSKQIFVQSEETVAIQVKLCRISNTDSAEQAGIKNL
jgi:hypothetical protein